MSESPTSFKRMSKAMLAKRQQILQVAIEIFAKEGYRNTDVQKIADQCSVGKGTVYRHFESKENLFWETGIIILEQIETMLNDTYKNYDDPLEIIRQFVISSGRFFEQHPLYVSILTQVRFMPKKQVPEKISKYFKSKLFLSLCNTYTLAMQQRTIVHGNVEDLNISISDALWGVILFYHRGEDKMSLVDRLLYTFDLFLNGLLIKPECTSNDSTPLP